MKILLPIALDQWRNPIAGLLRACVEFNPEYQFFARSNPQTEEDVVLGQALWGLPQLRVVTPSAVVRDRFDLVHTASCSRNNLWAVRLAKWRGWPHTRFLHTVNLESDAGHPEAHLNLQKVLRMADGLVAVSEAVAGEPRRLAPERFIGVIPNGFDCAFFDPEDPAAETSLPTAVRQGVQSGYALFLAALETRKHPEVLAELARRNPDVFFVGAGAEPPGPDLPKWLEMMKGLPNLFWLGQVTRAEVRSLLKMAGVLVFPSEREGLPLAVIEALGMGLPVIAQPRSSLPELIQDQVNGRLVDIRDLDAWSSAVRYYLGLPDEESTMLRRRIRQHTVGKFKWPSIGAAYAPVYARFKDRKAVDQPVNL